MQQGVPHGYYHFLLPNQIAEQADVYIHQMVKVGGPAGKVAPICDIEHIPSKRPRNKKLIPQWEHDNPQGAAWAYQVRCWLDQVEACFGQQCILYGSAESFSVMYDHGVPPRWLQGYPIWLAWYPYTWRIPAFKAGPPASVIPGWAGEVVAWQYFDKGRQNGYEPNDLDWVNPSYLERVRP